MFINFNKIFGLLLIVIGSSNIFSQSFVNQYYDTTFTKYEIQLSGNANYHSTSIQNDVSKKLIFGGQISDEVMRNAVENHSSMNRLAVQLQSEIIFRNYNTNFINEKYGWQAKIGTENIGFAKYSKDLFGLAALGNNDYLGQSLNFDGSQILYLSYLKAGFGIVNKKTKSNIGINLLYTYDYFSGNIYKGGVEFSPYGDQISTAFDGELRTMNKNGYGASVDFDYYFPVELFKKQTTFKLSGRNLGFITTSKYTSYDADTTFDYSGFSLNQLTNLDQFEKDNFSIMDSLGIMKFQGKYIRFIPGYIEFSKVVQLQSSLKFQSLFGVRFYPNIYSLPNFYLGVDYKASDHLRLGLINSIGGFGSYRLGLYASYNFNKFQLGVGSEDVLSFVSKSLYGQNLNIKLRCKI